MGDTGGGDDEEEGDSAQFDCVKHDFCFLFGIGCNKAPLTSRFVRKRVGPELAGARQLLAQVDPGREESALGFEEPHQMEGFELGPRLWHSQDPR